MDHGGVGALRSDIGREQIMVRGGVELLLVADQDIESARESRRGAERVFEPELVIVRRLRNAMLRHDAHGFFRNWSCVLEIDLVEGRSCHGFRTSGNLGTDSNSRTFSHRSLNRASTRFRTVAAC